MSLLKSIGKTLGNVGRAVSAMPGVGMVPIVGQIAGMASMLGQRSRQASPISTLLPAMGALPAVAGAAVRVGMIGARAAMRGAVAWCRRNPAWCATVGGTAAVAGMIESGQLPMPRRRRGRGLSARDLRGFRKTVRLVRATAASVGLRGGRGGRSKGGATTMITQN